VEAAGERGTFVWVGVFEKLEDYRETIHMVVKPARYVDPEEVIEV
jgi:hypothetical protein